MTESERIWASLIKSLEIQYNVKINYKLEPLTEEDNIDEIFGILEN